MQYVFVFAVFHCGFPVPERVEVDLQQSWIFEFEGDLFALPGIFLNQESVFRVEHSLSVLPCPDTKC